MADATATLKYVAEDLASGAQQRVAESLTEVNDAAAATTATVESYQRALATPPSASFARIAQDVELATADFKAGIISLDEYKVAMETARQEAIALRQQVQGISNKELTQFNGIINNTATSTAKLGGETRHLRTALAMMAFQVTGTQGEVGHLAQGLLLFGLGSEFMLAVAGGIALIGLMWESQTAETREATKAAKEAYDAQVKLLQAAKNEQQQHTEQRAALHSLLEERNQNIAAFKALLAEDDRAVKAGEVNTLTIFERKQAEHALNEEMKARVDIINTLNAIRATEFEKQKANYDREAEGIRVSTFGLTHMKEEVYALQLAYRVQHGELTQQQADELQHLKDKELLQERINDQNKERADLERRAHDEFIKQREEEISRLEAEANEARRVASIAAQADLAVTGRISPGTQALQATAGRRDEAVRVAEQGQSAAEIRTLYQNTLDLAAATDAARTAWLDMQLSASEAAAAGLDTSQLMMDVINSMPESLLTVEETAQMLQDRFGDAFGVGIDMAAELIATLDITNQKVQELVLAFTTGFTLAQQAAEVLGGGIGKGITAGVKVVAKVMGAFYTAEAIADIAKGIAAFPHGGQFFAAAAQHFEAAKQFYAIAGAGGGKSGGGGAGGQTGGPNLQSAQDQLKEASTLTIVIPKGSLNTSDPDVIDELVHAFEQAQGRRVTVQFGG